MHMIHRAAATLLLATLGVVGLQGVVGAQGYPGTLVGADSTITLVNQTVGSTFTITACGYANGSTVTIVVNGTADATVTAEGGCVSFTGVVTDPHLAIDGGTPISVAYGDSTVTAVGVGPLGGTITDAVTVPIVETTSPAPIAFTGADIAGMVLGGLALIALGVGTVIFSRRRRTALSE